MKKRIGVVLGGGGAKGAFQIGVLDQLLQKIDQDGDELVAISGTSIGAMNGAFIAAGQFNQLRKIWLGFTERNCPLIQSGFLGSTASLFLRGYSFESAPVYQFFQDNLDIAALRKSTVQYCNTRIALSDGKTLIGGNIPSAITAIKSDDDIILEIMASMAAIPLVPIVTVYGEQCVDGGFRDTIPVKTMLDTTDELDKIYIIACNPTNRIAYPKNLDNTTRSLWSKIRFVYDDILWDEVSRNDLELGRLKYWRDDRYTVIAPDTLKLRSAQFDAAKIRDAMIQGADTFKEIL